MSLYACASQACKTYQIALGMEITNEMDQVFLERRALRLSIDRLGGYPTQCLILEARNDLVQWSSLVVGIELGNHGCETCFERCVVRDYVLLL